MQTSTATMKWALTVVVLCCYSLAVIKATSSGFVIQNLENTSHIEDYVTQNQRQYAAKILAMEAELNTFKLYYDKQLEIMELQSKLLEDNMQKVNKSLEKREAISKLIKGCINKYKSELATVDSVKSDIAKCVALANSTFDNIVAPANVTKTSLENFYNNELTSMLNDCKRKKVNELSYTSCVTNTIARADSVTASYQKIFSSQMEMTYVADHLNPIAGPSHSCSFSDVHRTAYNTMLRIGEVTQKIDNCSHGKDADKSNICPYKHNSKHIVRFYDKTLENPFYGMKYSIPCLLLTF